MRVISRAMKPEAATLTEIIERVEQRLNELGISAREAGERVGNIDLIAGIRRNHRRGTQTSLTTRNLHRLASALETTPHWLLTGTSAQDEQAPSHPQPALAAPKPLDAFHKDLPVLGLAAGSIINGVSGTLLGRRPIGYIMRPPRLAGIPNAYAIRVTGTSMEPTLRPGDLCIVDPNMAAGEHDLVIVQTQHHAQDPGQTYVKFLGKRSQAKVTLFQTNPAATIDIPLHAISSVHRVLTVAELFSDDEV